VSLKLTNIRVENFKCIEDSTPFRIDNLTAFVGKNESGKSAILEALYKLNPVEATENNFDELDYPRRQWSQYKQRREKNPDNVLTTIWELDEGDTKAVVDIVGPNALIGNVITVKKGYDNIPRYTVSLDDKKVAQNLIAGADLFQEERDALGEVASVPDLVTKLQAIEQPAEKQTKLLAAVTKKFPNNKVMQPIVEALHARLPKFVLFSSYYKLPGEVALAAYAARKAQGASHVTSGDRVFEALMDLAGVTTDGIQTINKFESLIAELESVQAHLTSQIFKYWTQNKHLRVLFHFDAARPEDPAPFNSGYIFRTRIWNNRHEVSVGFDERSSGFVWFFSFLVWFSQVKKNYAEKLVILLDEPGLSLHARAQADLLRYIKEKLLPEHQVLYTTHSPFMVDGENLLSARTVEDMTAPDETVLGTKVGDEVLSTDADTVFPLQAASATT